MASKHEDEYNDEENRKLRSLHTRKDSVVRIAIDSSSEDSFMEEDHKKEDKWAEEEEPGEDRTYLLITALIAASAAIFTFFHKLMKFCGRGGPEDNVTSAASDLDATAKSASANRGATAC